MSTVAQAAQLPAVPAAPRGVLVGGALSGTEPLEKVLRTLRASRAAGDIVGFAIPLTGDPTTPDGLVALAQPRQRQGFDPVRLLTTIIDPHAPAPNLATLRKGQNSILARAFLGDLANWLVGVTPFRIPGPTDDHPGVWVLGHINHAAAVAGMEGSAGGGTAGALASLGIPPELVEEYWTRLQRGECLVTTCETDTGRAQRDRKLLSRQGAGAVFQVPVVPPPGKQA